MSAPADALTGLREKFPNAAARASQDHPAVTVPIHQVLAVLNYLKAEFAFDMLVDVTAIDWAEGVSPRFTVVYHLLSTTRHAYIRVAADCTNDVEPEAPSIVGLWPAANWHERETYDMFGITFSGHPDLRRILMWDGYRFFPLRKEFPLAGIETALPDAEVAAETGNKVVPAPMVGGPFVASTGEMNMTEAEPRAKDESWSEKRPKSDGSPGSGPARNVPS